MFLADAHALIGPDNRFSAGVDVIERLRGWDTIGGSGEFPQRNNGISQFVLGGRASEANEADTFGSVGSSSRRHDEGVCNKMQRIFQ